jgi:hypothetical protein
MVFNLSKNYLEVDEKFQGEIPGIEKGQIDEFQRLLGPPEKQAGSTVFFKTEYGCVRVELRQREGAGSSVKLIGVHHGQCCL